MSTDTRATAASIHASIQERVELAVARIRFFDFDPRLMDIEPDKEDS